MHRPAARPGQLPERYALIQAAKQTAADSIHPGYGFLAENAEFAAACGAEGIAFVGPTSEAIERMGDKALARTLAREADVPTVPGTDGTASLDDALATAAELGSP